MISQVWLKPDSGIPSKKSQSQLSTLRPSEGCAGLLQILKGPPLS
jgi:hypothetical protein